MQRHIFNCSSGYPVESTLQIILSKWESAIPCHLIENKVCRFSELQKKMPNCSRRMLSLQLNELEKDKIIEKKMYPVIPPKTEYKMTRFDETLAPIILEVDKWGQTYSSINSKVWQLKMLQNYLNSNILEYYSYIIYLFFRLKHIQLEVIGLLFIT